MFVAAMQRHGSLPAAAIDTDKRRVASLRQLLSSQKPFGSITWTINDMAPSRGSAVRFYVVADMHRQGVGDADRTDVVNAAYDRRSDAILITAPFAQLLADNPGNDLLRDFATFMLLHELGHREGAHDGSALADVRAEELRADRFAVARYLAVSGGDLTTLVDQVWNIAEGPILGIFTQYGPFDPVTDYATHGGFLFRISNLYAAILEDPRLRSEDRKFVARLAAQTQQFVRNSSRFAVTIALPRGRVAVAAAVCGYAVAVLDDTGGLYRIPVRSLVDGTAAGHVIDVGPAGRLQLVDESGAAPEIRTANCDGSGRLIVQTEEDGRLLEQADMLFDPRRLKPLSIDGAPDDWLVDGNSVRLGFIESDHARLVRFSQGRPTIATDSLVEARDCGPDCSAQRVYLQPNGGLLLLASASGSFLRPIESRLAPMALSSKAVVVVDQTSTKFATVERAGSAFRVTTSDTFGTPSSRVMMVPDLGASDPASESAPLRLRLVADKNAQSRCYGIAVPGHILAIACGGEAKPRFLDGYLSATDILISLGNDRFLASIPYSRFLVVIQ